MRSILVRELKELLAGKGVLSSVEKAAGGIGTDCRTLEKKMGGFGGSNEMDESFLPCSLDMVSTSGTVQSLSGITHVRPVIEHRRHSIDRRLHHIRARFSFRSCERVSLRRYRPRASAYRRDMSIITQALLTWPMMRRWMDRSPVP